MAVHAFHNGTLNDYAVYGGAIRGAAAGTVHQHDYIEIFLNLTDPQTFLIGDRMYSVAPGDLMLVNCGEQHAVMDKANGNACFVEVRPEFLLTLCTDQTNLLSWLSLDGSVPQRKVALSETELGEMRRLIRMCQNRNGSYGWDVLERVHFIELMVAISRCFQTARQNARVSVRYSELLAPALRYVEEHLEENFALQDMADHIGVSKCYLCKIFKNGTGTTVNQYVMARRIHRAKQLLRTGKNVTEVSAEVGFNDYSYFIKSFKSLTGVTPAKFAWSAEYAI